MRDVSKFGPLDPGAALPTLLRCPDCSMPTLEVVDRVYDERDSPVCITHCLHCGRLAQRLEADLPPR